MKVFEKAGFSCVRIEGDHYVYTKEGVIRPIVIPDWREMPVFIRMAYIPYPFRVGDVSHQLALTLDIFFNCLLAYITYTASEISITPKSLFFPKMLL